VVVLFDTHRKWQQPARDAGRALIVWPPTALAPVHFSFDFAQAKTGARDHWQVEEQARERIEEGALLYVAATRAKKRLIVTGHEKRKPIKDSWWEMCAAQQAEQSWAETIPASAGQDALLQLANYVASVPFNPHPGYADLIRMDSAAAAAGIALHALLEVAAALPFGERNSAGEVLCQRVARALALPLNEVQRAWQEAQRVLQAPLLAPFFAAEHLARTEWQLLAADGTLQRLDRVVWLPRATWVLDFKRIGDRTPPLEYAQQLRAYAATVRALEPGRPVRCAVITDLALLYELNSDANPDSAHFVQISDATQLH
jgi:ATP-dependent helicase/nuclease subunit A